MYNYAKTMDDLSEDTKLSFIATKEIRVEAAAAILNSRMFRTKIKHDIEFIKKGLAEIICSINQVLASFLGLNFTTYAKTFNGFLFGRQWRYGNGVCRLFSVRNNSNYLAAIFGA